MSVDATNVAQIVNDNFEVFDTARQGNTDKADGKISMNDLRTIADNPRDFGGDNSDIVKAARFLLESEAVRSALDVGAGRGWVDGTISEEDIRGVLDAISSGTFERRLLDTAAGRGRLDEHASAGDIGAALDDPGIPQELKDALLLLRQGFSGNAREFSDLIHSMSSDDFARVTELVDSAEFAALSDVDQNLVAEIVRDANGDYAVTDDLLLQIRDPAFQGMDAAGKTAKLDEFGLLYSARAGDLPLSDQRLIDQALTSPDRVSGDTGFSGSVRSLVASEHFQQLSADQKTAILHQILNYPDERSVANLERLISKDWFRDFDLPDTQRAAKTIAFLSQYDDGDRDIIDNTLDSFLAEDAPFTFDFTATSGYGSASGTHFRINPAHIAADNGKVDTSERSADRGELRVIGHTMAHEVNHLANEDSQRARGTAEDFHVEYRAFYVGFMAQHGREPTVADVIDRVGIFVNRDGAYDHMSDILDAGGDDAQEIVDYVNYILGRDDITLDTVVGEVNDLIAELQSIEGSSGDLSDPEHADHVLNRPAGEPQGERNNLDNSY